MTNMKLYVWPAADGLESSSPYCLKALYAARYKKVPVELSVVKVGPPSWARRGKLPVAELAGRRVEDSTNILKALDEVVTTGARLYPESKSERAETLLLEDWSDESFYLNIVYYRWGIDSNFAPFSAQVFSEFPTLVRKLVSPIARRDALAMLSDKGILHESEATRRQRYLDALGVLEHKLAARRFLASDEPTAADFSVYPLLAIIRGARLPELEPALASSPRLTSWMDDVRRLMS